MLTLILDHADNIKRIIASLALKTTSQYNIVRKLSSFSRVNKTQQALWQYNNIVKTAFTLEFIHSETMRQNTQKILSRQEGYHRLKRKVFYAHEGKFHVHTHAEQEIWSECERLITNIIIYYNVWLLSELLQQYEKQGNKAQADFIKTVSPIAWRHINVYGTYNFNNRISSSDLAKILKKINIAHLLKNMPLGTLGINSYFTFWAVHSIIACQTFGAHCSDKSTVKLFYFEPAEDFWGCLNLENCDPDNEVFFFELFLRKSDLRCIFGGKILNMLKDL